MLVATESHLTPFMMLPDPRRNRQVSPPDFVALQLRLLATLVALNERTGARVAIIEN
jgi:hypothetical protein